MPDNNTITRDDAITQIIASIAAEEVGLGELLEAESMKLKYALGVIPDVPGPDKPLTAEELLSLNDSLRKTIDSTMISQFILKEKLASALAASTMQGPQGPEGPPGPPIEHGTPLFSINSGTDSEQLTYEGSLTFESESLDISVEQGTIVKIEHQGSSRSIIPFSSGTQLKVDTAFSGGGRNQCAMVGFGAGGVVNAPDDPITLPIAGAVEATVQTEFSVPSDSVITAFSAFFTAMSGGLASVANHVTAQLYAATDPNSNEFVPLEDAKIEFEPITGSILPSISRNAHLSNLNIEIPAHSRLLVVYSCTTPDYSISTYILGYMSGSIELK